LSSVVAIEKRVPGEEVKKGPTMEELVARESVDELVYIGWEEEVKPAESKDAAAASKEPTQKLSSEERQSLVARIKDAKDWNRFDGILSLSLTHTHLQLAHLTLLTLIRVEESSQDSGICRIGFLS